MPRIQTTPMVKVALYALRVYLIVLLSLILIKFIRMLSGKSPSPTVPAQVEKPASP